MRTEVTHDSAQPGAMSQLDAAFAQAREWCRSEPWLLSVITYDDGTRGLKLATMLKPTESRPPVAEAATAEGDEAEDGTDVVPVDAT